MVFFPERLIESQYIANIVEHFSNADSEKLFAPKQIEVLAQAITLKIFKALTLSDKEETIKDIRYILANDDLSKEALDLACIYGDLPYYKMGKKESALRAFAAYNVNVNEEIAFPLANEKEFLKLQKEIFTKCAEEILHENEHSRKRKHSNEEDNTPPKKSPPPNTSIAPLQATGVLSKAVRFL